MRRSTAVLLTYVTIIVVMSSCYGPSHMTNHRSPDAWGKPNMKCDAYLEP